MVQPEPMNAMPRHSKAKVSLFFSESVFVAGDELTGKLELECKAERGLGISDIKVELFAIQELTSKYHSATNTFLHLTRYFQGPGLPPSNAVHAYPSESDDDVLPVDYYTARKGITTFFFRFPLPQSSPSSIDFGKGLAKLKYEVRASAGISWRNERQRIMERQEVSVVEIPRDTSDSVHTVVGENGRIWVQGRVLNSFAVAGQDVCVELLAKNHSSLRNSSLSLNLIQHLCLPGSSESQGSLPLSSDLLSIPYKGPEYIVEPGTEGVANLVFTVPRHASSIRPGNLNTGGEDDGPREVESLFNVQCKIDIKFDMGFGNKDIILELPIPITHPISMGLYAEQLSPLDAPRITSPAFNLPPIQTPPDIGYEAINVFTPMYMSPSVSPTPYFPHQPWFRSPPLPQLLPLQNQNFLSLSPPAIPQGYLIRSSSADPYIAQQLPIPLPVHSQQTLLDVDPDLSQTSIPKTVNGLEPEIGKGERASRISAHLRLSSRTRSVSPQSHRFPVNAVAAITGSPGTAKINQQYQNVQAATAYASPQQLDQPNEPDAELLSPRPILVHKQSFTVDHGTMKSDRVLDLERMAAEDVTKEEDTKGHEKEKTLPSIPPASESTISCQDLPPEPTLSPLTVRTRPEIWKRESGLAALERKLLEQVGTRKLESQRHADVRTVMPITIPTPDGARYEPLNDSAISSLALGAVESPIVASQARTPEIDHSENEFTLSANHVAVSTEENANHKVTKDSKEKYKKTEAYKLRKAATGRVAAWLGGISIASPPSTDPTPPVTDSPASPVAELTPTKESGTHPLLRSSPSHIAGSVAGQTPEKIPTRSSGFVLQTAKDSSTFTTQEGPSDHPHSPTVTQSNAEVANVPPAPEDTKTPPSKPVLRRFLDRPESDPHNPESKYDVRSARGGKGGKVTSVVALWSSMASDQRTESNPGNFDAQKAGPPKPHTPRLQHQYGVTKQQEPTRKKHLHEPANAYTHINVADLTARRAKLIKSTSVPAVLSSSLATPVLSSTASLARPIQQHSYPKQSYPLDIQQSLSLSQTAISTSAQQSSKADISGSKTPLQSPIKTTTVGVSGSLAFGQARLKDLIRKYQQGFGQ